jgi:hypothetical protein
LEREAQSLLDSQARLPTTAIPQADGGNRTPDPIITSVSGDASGTA